MNNLSKHVVDLNEFTKKTAKVVEQSVGDPALQESIKQASEVCKKIGSVAMDMAQTALALTSEIVGIVQQYDFESLFKGLQRYILPLKYISILRRMKWPLFFIEDESFRNAIMDTCSREDNYEAVKSMAISYCNEGFIERIRKEWKNNPGIVEARFPILSEALDLHKQGAYYGSTSILMCQLYGICNDIVALTHDKGLVLTSEDKDLIAEHFNLDRKYLDKNEKGKLFQTVFFTENGILLWEAMVEYLRDVVLRSSLETKVVSDQPLRNKICHGSQMDYGTEEHSLKAVLTIDMLMQLAIAIEGINVPDNYDK